jgi:hypothetical protein
VLRKPVELNRFAVIRRARLRARGFPAEKFRLKLELVVHSNRLSFQGA